MKSRILIAAALIVGFTVAAVWGRYGARPEAAPSDQRADVTLYRFFGGCSDEYSGVTDISQAVGECGIIQVLTNGFNAANDRGAVVHTQSIEWSAYYDRLSAAYATRHPPTVAIMNQSALPRFANNGLLLPLKQELVAAGVPVDDVIPAALAAVTFDGDMYGLPFDIHALLWHVNLDLMEQAGLVDANGEPVLPTTPGELLAHAKRLRDKTGHRYLAIPSQTDPMPVWTFETWVWQQRSALVSADLHSVQVNTVPAETALRLLHALYEKGYANPGHDYAGAEQAFLNGEAAILINGTWVVDSYLAQAQLPGVKLKRYTVHTVPTLFDEAAAWADSHVWVIPRQEELNAAAHDAAIALLKFFFEQSGHWAKTGHLPVRKSTLAGRAFQSLPQRTRYMDTAAIAHGSARVDDHRAIQDTLIQDINATWILPRNPRESLHQAQEHVERLLERRRR